jgi:acetyltransferase-like isoleucine patch superfamily enzyme
MTFLLDKTYLKNPLQRYLQWLILKIKLQFKYRKDNLRIGYMSFAYNTKFGKYNWLNENCNIYNSSLGDFSYVSNEGLILNSTIGKFTSIGPNVKIAPGNHPTRTIISTHPAIYSNPNYCLKNFAKVDNHHYKRGATIGNDVWICANVVISDGITIGDGAIIAANSLVTKDVLPYTIVSGVPAVYLKDRFSRENINFLLKFKWWDKPITWLEKNNELLLNVDALFTKYANDTINE